MTKEPYASARRVFWIVDNGSSPPRPALASSASRAAGRTSSSSTCRSTPAGSTRSRSTSRSSSASCSTPTTSPTPPPSPRALNAFEHHYNEIAEPFEWNFTRDDLAALLDRLEHRQAGRHSCSRHERDGTYGGQQRTTRSARSFRPALSHTSIRAADVVCRSTMHRTSEMLLRGSARLHSRTRTRGTERVAGCCRAAKKHGIMPIGFINAQLQPQPKLPKGQVTFLLTDIEGSTELLRRLDDQYAPLLADIRRRVRDAVRHAAGHEVSARGDDVFAVFERRPLGTGGGADDSANDARRRGVRRGRRAAANRAASRSSRAHRHRLRRPLGARRSAHLLRGPWRPDRPVLRRSRCGGRVAPGGRQPDEPRGLAIPRPARAGASSSRWTRLTCSPTSRRYGRPSCRRAGRVWPRPERILDPD